jgi:hypothetical protein
VFAGLNHDNCAENNLIVALGPLCFGLGLLEADVDLENKCFAPEQAATLLKTLRTADWEQLDRQRLQSLWPVKFRVSEECEVREGTSIYPCALMSAGFCLESVCYCNIAFNLNIKPGVPEKLNSLTMFYSNKNLEKVISVAKLFVSALTPLTEKYSRPHNAWQFDETNHVSKMFRYYPDYSYQENNAVYSGGDVGVQLELYTLENGISSVYLYAADPAELRPPNKSLKPTTPATHNVMVLAMR